VNPPLRLELADAAAQEACGARLAAACPAKALIFLRGDLGAGKTTLVRGLLRARGERGPVRSPTYTLIEPYETVDGRVYHLDLYRLAAGEELEFLGLRDMLDEAAVMLVEWPERGGDWLPQPDLTITIEHLAEGRALTFQAATPVGAAIVAAMLDDAS
jgi:tRNA threonylcarbamoyladenosine biosynthesis protein TsaE